jgi:hypothetical protein
MARPESILDINFHDSNLLEAYHENKTLTVAIDIDTFWDPGKPFGIIKLKDPENFEDFLNFSQACKGGMSISGISMIKTKGGFEFTFAPHWFPKEYEGEHKNFIIKCKSFSYDRVDGYKDFQHAKFAGPTPAMNLLMVGLCTLFFIIVAILLALSLLR